MSPTPRPRQDPIPRAVAAAFGTASAVALGKGAHPPALLARRKARAEQRMVEALEARGARAVPAALAGQLAALAKGWAERGFDDRFDDAARFEERCFEEGEIARARTEGDASAAVEAAYRRAVIEEYGRIEIRGLQMSERVTQDLDLAYVPLWVEDDSGEPQVIKAGEGMDLRVLPRLTVPELVAKYSRAVLVGAPGSGKSTVVVHLAVQAARGKLSSFAGAEDVVPFLVAVRSLRGRVLDEEAITAGASGIGVDFVAKVLAEGRGLVLVDGLDEAQEGATALLPSLQKLARVHPGNRVLVTTRPAGALGEERPQISGFASTTLTPMSRDDVYEFIGKWCEAAELSIQKDKVKATGDGQRAAEDLKARVQASRPVERLAQTPLMCSVLCIVHRFLGQRIPERRVALYEACTNVLLYEWDQAKFPAGAAVGKLDAQEKKVLLGGLARWMHEKKLAEVAHEDVARVFTARLAWVKHEPEEAGDIVREIRDRSGILLERRPGFFAFSHLMFQEYLAAVEVVRAGDILKLARKCKDRWWHEVTILAAGLPTANAPGLIQALLRIDAKNEVASGASFLAAQCAEASIHLTASVRRAVDKRIESLIPPKSEEDVERLVEVGEVAAPLLLRAIGHATPPERARMATAVGRMRYEAGSKVLAEMLSDRRKTGETTTALLGSFKLEVSETTPVRNIAEMALFSIALKSSLARAVFEEAIAHDRQGFFWRLSRRTKNRKLPYVRLLGREASEYIAHIWLLMGKAQPETTSAAPSVRSD